MWKIAESGKYKSIEDMMLIVDPEFTILEGYKILQVVSFKEVKVDSYDAEEGYEINRDFKSLYIFDKGENLLMQLDYRVKIDNNTCMPIVKEIGDVLSIGYFSFDMLDLADKNAPRIEYEKYTRTWWNNSDRSFDFARLKQEYYKIDTINGNENNLKVTKAPIPTHSVQGLKELKYKGKVFGYSVHAIVDTGEEFLTCSLIYTKDFKFIGNIDDKMLKLIIDAEPTYRHADASIKSGRNWKNREFNALMESYSVRMDEDFIAQIDKSFKEKSDEEQFDIWNDYINSIYSSVAKQIVYDGDKPLFALGDGVGKIIDFKVDDKDNIEMEALEVRFDEHGEVIDPFKELADSKGEIIIAIAGKNSDEMMIENDYCREVIEVYLPGTCDCITFKFRDTFNKLWNIKIPEVYRMEKDQSLEENQYPSLMDTRIQLLNRASAEINGSNTYNKPVKLLCMDSTTDLYKYGHSYEVLASNEVYDVEDANSIKNKVEKVVESSFKDFVDEIKSIIDDAILCK